MAGSPINISNLTDGELYQQLRKNGFDAGPVVASTRKLYEGKLSQILEGRRGRGDEQDLFQRGDEMEERLSQPVKTVGGLGHVQWSPDSKSGSVRPRTNLSHVSSTYSGDVAAGSSSYLGTARDVRNYDDNFKASSSWLPSSTVTQPYTPPTWRTYGSSGPDAFGTSRYRTTLSDTSPAAREDMTSRYRFTGLSDQRASLWNRRNPERQRNKSLSSKAQFGVFVFLLLVAIVFCYVVYNAWHENDPYSQIEQEAIRITEESKAEHQQG